MEVARMAIQMSRGQMTTEGALSLTDGRLVHVEFDPQEFARLSQAEDKLADLTKNFGKFADTVRFAVEAALARSREMAETFQRGVPVEQVAMEMKFGGLHFAIDQNGQTLDLNAGQWKYDKAEAEKFIQALNEMKKGGVGK